MIEEHEETFDKDNIRDFVDLYLQMSRSCDDDSKGIFTSKFTQKSVRNIYKKLNTCKIETFQILDLLI